MQHHDPHHNLEVQAHGASVVQMESSKLLPWLMLCCVLSGIAVALAVVMTVVYTQNYRELEREYRLQRLETDEMNVRLELAGIPKHRKGDSP